MLPLSEKIRPKTLSDVAGQDKLVKTIQTIIENGRPLSLLLYGPPGSGKTTIARIYANSFNIPFEQVSAVLNSTAELKRILNQGKDTPLFRRPVLVFVDEIHRFNRAQQDLFLPFIEDGSLVLVGATTENPSFVLNNALLSRMRPLQLEPLNESMLETILERTLILAEAQELDQDQKKSLIQSSGGDARHLINQIENLICGIDPVKKQPLYDKHQESHYNLISALHKSIRGSDPDAALYWLARMLDGGEDPNYLARRLIRIAIEDVGLADPEALNITINASKAYHMLGSPEGELALAQAVIYLSLSPKSVASYQAYKKACKIASQTGHIDPPKHILNAPTQFMREAGYGKHYEYDPETPYGISGQTYFPESVSDKDFYDPVERGFEREMKKRLAYFSRLRKLASI